MDTCSALPWSSERGMNFSGEVTDVVKEKQE